MARFTVEGADDGAALRTPAIMRAGLMPRSARRVESVNAAKDSEVDAVDAVV